MRTRTRRTPRRPRLLLPPIEPLPALLPELPFGHHVAQELRRLEAGAEGGGEILGDAETHVEADQIGEAQRSHRMVVAELHGAIDVLRRGDAFLEHANRFETDGHTEA